MNFYIYIFTQAYSSECMNQILFKFKYLLNIINIYCDLTIYFNSFIFFFELAMSEDISIFVSTRDCVNIVYKFILQITIST